MRDVFGRKQVTAISPSWLVWPTLSELPYGPEAVGTTPHLKEITAIIDRWGSVVTAELAIEEKGQFAGAVRLRVGGAEVGTVPHGIADDYRAVIRALNSARLAATCRVSASPGESAPWLLIHGKPAPRQDGEPFLPPIGAGDFVVLGAGQAERLDGLLNSRAKKKHVDAVAVLTPVPGEFTVSLGGVAVGALPGLYPLVRAAGQAGFPMTARAVLRRDPERGFRLQVFAPSLPG
jgi:hypothetical protein